MERISINAMAKINLGLDVLRRRENGYHDVKMIMQTVNIYDTLDFVKLQEITLQKEELEKEFERLIAQKNILIESQEEI